MDELRNVPLRIELIRLDNGGVAPLPHRSSHEDALCVSSRRFTCQKCLKPVCFCGSSKSEQPICQFCEDFDNGVFEGMTYEGAEAFNWSAEWWAAREQGRKQGLTRNDFK